MCRPSLETPAFLGDERLLGLSDAERLAIVTWVAADPAAGDVIEGTGGARKKCGSLERARGRAEDTVS